MNSSNTTREAILAHTKAYPLLQLTDLFKFLHQSSFGCEHLLSDPSSAIDYIKKEADSISSCSTSRPDSFTEDLDGSYGRVHLDLLARGLRPETLGTLFFLSAQKENDGPRLLEEKLMVLLSLCKEGLLPFSEEEAELSVRRWRADGYPPVRHSDCFRDAYAPAYRVIKKDYLPFLPLLLFLDRLPESAEPGIIAIEGGSAGGKTTLGNLLHRLYDCTIFHMDDFFLQPEQRTKARLKEPGGNVDRERFLQEVLLPLRKNQPVQYRRFDCSTFTIGEASTLFPSKLNIVEGAYSMHPDLAPYYDASVFLDVDPMLQKNRILHRNTPETAELFFSRWIPMELRYFETMHIKEQCSLVIPITD